MAASGALVFRNLTGPLHSFVGLEHPLRLVGDLGKVVENGLQVLVHVLLLE
jgi:hypothetical protein